MDTVCINMFVSLAQICIAYIAKEVASFRGAWSINLCGV